MVIYTIYRATNIINNKSYIGFDSAWPNRMKTHKMHYKPVNNGIAFYSAIRKYGWDNFKWEVLYQSLDGMHTKDSMEGHFINEYRTYVGFKDCNGYNMTLGGEGVLGRFWTEQQKNELSKKLTGYKASEEHRKNNSIAQRNRPPTTEQTRQNLSISHTGLKRSERFKKEQSIRAKEKGWKPPGVNHNTENYESVCKKISTAVTEIWELRRKNGTATGNFIWITDGIDNIKIKTRQEIPIGWKRGRTMKRNVLTGTFIKQGDTNEYK